MIKIEKINAPGATVIRNGIVQSLLTGSTLTPEELASVTAVEGTVVYSVDEQEVKTLVFLKPEVVVVTTDSITPVVTTTTDSITPVITKPAVKQPAPRTPKVAKPE